MREGVIGKRWLPPIYLEKAPAARTNDTPCRDAGRIPNKNVGVAWGPSGTSYAPTTPSVACDPFATS
jgi:hypothetical protein